MIGLRLLLSARRKDTYISQTLFVLAVVHSLLPPTNEVWGKVIFLHLFVILFTGGGVCLVQGGLLRGVPGPGGGCLAWSRRGPWSRGRVPGLVPEGCLAPGGCLVETPRMATAAGGTHSTGMHSCCNCERTESYVFE